MKKKQLREGVVAFKKVLAGDSSFLEVLEELELREEDDEVSESSSDEDDDNYERKEERICSLPFRFL